MIRILFFGPLEEIQRYIFAANSTAKLCDHAGSLRFCTTKKLLKRASEVEVKCVEGRSFDGVSFCVRAAFTCALQ